MVYPSSSFKLSSGRLKTEHCFWPAGTMDSKVVALSSLMIRFLGVLLTIIPLLLILIFLQKMSQLGLIFIRVISTPTIVNTLCILPLIYLSTIIREVDSPIPPIKIYVAKSKIEFTPHILNLLPTSSPISTTLSSYSFTFFCWPPNNKYLSLFFYL